MSRLHDELEKRMKGRTLTPPEQDAIDKYNLRVASFQSLLKNKEFREYLKLEEEMNDPKIIVAHDCSDPVCMALKRKVGDFWNRKKVLEVALNGKRSGPEPRATSR